MTFGERVKAKRIAAGLTQEELGSLVGLQKSGVAKYENGRIRAVSTDVAQRFADALHCGVHELLNTFERNLYALDMVVKEEDDGVHVTTDGGVSALFTWDAWYRIKNEGRVSAVLEGLGKAKEAPGDTEGLSPDRQALIDLVMNATEEEVRALRGIVNQVLALRGK